MLLIATCSQDVTTDLLLPYLKDIEVFRFDIDKWNNYGWDFSPKGFEICNTDGLRLSDRNLKCIYWRKPIFFDFIDIPAGGCLENWTRCEVKHAFEDLFYDFALKKKAILVHPGNSQWFKNAQMTLAQKFFKVPEWHIARGHIPEAVKSGEWVVKSYSPTLIGKGKMFICKRADISKLDPYYPWFFQRRIKAEYDITTLYVNGKLFSFRLDRSKLTRDDCRLETPSLTWEKCSLSQAEEDAVKNFMRETGFDFGRFDFLRAGNDLYFLELNPNGQWAWLDLEHKHGIFECIADEIKRAYKR